MQHRNVRALLIHTLARPTIKALTLTQPWATLVASGAKEYETRSWQRGYRGPVAIHAARGDPSEAHWLCEQDPFRLALHHALHTDGTLPGSVLAAALPVGKVIAIALLDALHPTERLVYLSLLDGRGQRCHHPPEAWVLLRQGHRAQC